MLEILQCIPVVKIFAFLELERNCSSVDEHYLRTSGTYGIPQITVRRYFILLIHVRVPAIDSGDLLLIENDIEGIDQAFPETDEESRGKRGIDVGQLQGENGDAPFVAVAAERTRKGVVVAEVKVAAP